MTQVWECKQYSFRDEKSDPEIICEYPGTIPQDCPLVIDNGSYQFRVGWMSNDEPSIVFKNVIARNRGNKKDRDWDLLVGNNIPDLETVRWMIRTAFDFNVVVNFGVQESVFDHAFSHLGISTDGRICHPIVMTEPAGNPQYSRKQMSELLFEAYDIPKLAYGIDSLFSYQFNKDPLKLGSDALIVASGFQSTHVLPIIDGALDVSNCKRINLGGYNNGAYLQRFLQLRYPKLTTAFTLTRMDQFLRDLGEVPNNYVEKISEWADKEFSTRNTIMMQIPDHPNPPSNQAVNPPSKETITLGRKLRQMECRLYDLECILELEQENPDVFSKVLADAGFTDTEEVDKKMQEMQEEIEQVHEDVTKSSLNTPVPSAVPIRIEKHQALEILFQPMLVGYEQAGIGDVIEIILKQYTPEQCDRMARNVLITGGNSQYKGFKERVEAELVKCRPFGSSCRVQMAQNPSLDAWNGARQWAGDNKDQEQFWMTKKDFDEMGWDYLKEHSASNRYLRAMGAITGQE